MLESLHWRGCTVVSVTAAAARLTLNLLVANLLVASQPPTDLEFALKFDEKCGAPKYVMQ
jgi:hypothetical protein